MKHISSRQFFSVIFFVTIVTKFLYLPSVLSNFSGKSIFLVTSFLFLIDGTFICLLFYILKTQRNITFFPFLTEKFSKNSIKIITFLLFIYFFLKTLLIILESNSFFQVAFYSNFTRYEFLIGLLILIFFILTLKFKTLIKAYELFKTPFFIFVFLIVIISFIGVNYLNVLPVLEEGLEAVFLGASKSTIWFGDFIILFLFLGKIKVEKNFTKKAVFNFILASVFVTIFMLNFYTNFSSVSFSKEIALYSLLQSLTSTSVVYKMGWIVYIVWTIALMFAICLFTFATNLFFKKTFCIKNSSICVLTLFVFGLILLSFDAKMLIEIITIYLSPIILILQYGLPLLLVCAFLKKKGGVK